MKYLIDLKTNIPFIPSFITYDDIKYFYEDISTNFQELIQNTLKEDKELKKRIDIVKSYKEKFIELNLLFKDTLITLNTYENYSELFEVYNIIEICYKYYINNPNIFNTRNSLDLLDSLEEQAENISDDDFINSLQSYIKNNNKIQIDEDYSNQIEQTLTNIKNTQSISWRQLGIISIPKSHQVRTIIDIKDRKKSILVSQTGSGKSLMALMFAELMFANKLIEKCVIISERNENIWYEEIGKHLLPINLRKYSVITYYNMENKIEEQYKKLGKTLFIFDEVHLLKNESNRGEFIQNLQPLYFLGLTATLFDREKNLINLFSNLNLPKLSINKNEEIIEKEILNQFIYNVEKIKLGTFSITNNNIGIKLPIINDYEDRVREIYANYNGNFAVTHKILKYLSNDIPNKLIELNNIVFKHHNQSIIIFCNYIQTVDTVYNHLSSFCDVRRLTGEIDNEKKDKIIADFIYGKFKILICSSVLSASYNLQVCNNMVFFDHDYNIIKRIQSRGRISRLGQKKTVNYYSLYYKNTLEEVIINTLKDKENSLEKVQIDLVNSGIKEAIIRSVNNA